MCVVPMLARTYPSSSACLFWLPSFCPFKLQQVLFLCSIPCASRVSYIDRGIAIAKVTAATARIDPASDVTNCMMVAAASGAMQHTRCKEESKKNRLACYKSRSCDHCSNDLGKTSRIVIQDFANLQQSILLSLLLLLLLAPLSSP